MKKIGKITINPEKVIKNEELINLKGGYDGPCCHCNSGNYIVGSTELDCSADCYAVFGMLGEWEC